MNSLLRHPLIVRFSNSTTYHMHNTCILMNVLVQNVLIFFMATIWYIFFQQIGSRTPQDQLINSMNIFTHSPQWFSNSRQRLMFLAEFFLTKSNPHQAIFNGVPEIEPTLARYVRWCTNIINTHYKSNP